MSERWAGVKAIETAYSGCRFRSRLEARWAVFLDTLGIGWEYEPEGFELDGIRYLPDFWLPDLDCFIEVKPTYGEVADRRKARRLAIATGKLVYMLYGPVGPAKSRMVYPDGENEPGEVKHVSGGTYFAPNGGFESMVEWGECAVCGRFGLAQFGAVGMRDWGSSVVDDCKIADDGPPIPPGWPCETPRLMAAYAAARSARFGTFGR